ncbi:MAG: DUF2339 domain-containing protein [SAR202 cluster bacterium]|nr:DUF2339 domain-containing protein [SAR202 cluster bacterium]
MNTCNNCHKENAKNSKFCIFCGFTINSDPITQPDRYLTDESENYIDEDDLDSLNRQLSILNEKFTNLEHRIRSLEKSRSGVSDPFVQKTGRHIGKPITEGPAPSLSGVQTSFLGKFASVNWFAVIGSIILAIGIGFFIKAAFDLWIGPTGRIIIGIVAGICMIGISEYASKRFPDWAYGICGGGLAILYIAVYASFGFYQLIDPIPVFIALLFVVLFGGSMALRHDSKVIAFISIIGAFITPVLMKTEIREYIYLGIVYILLIDIGIVALASRKKWQWYTLLGLIGSYVVGGLIASELPDSDVIYSQLGLSGVFLIFIVATVIHNVYNRSKPDNFDFSLIIANAGIFFGLTMSNLAESYEQWLGLSTILLSLLYAVIGIIALRNNNTPKLISFCFLGVSLIFITVFIPVQLTGAWITVAWSTQAAVVIGIGMKFKDSKIRIGGLAVLAAAIIHALAFDTFAEDINWFGTGSDTTPILNYRFFAFIICILACYISAYIYMIKRNLAKEWEKYIGVVLFAAATFLSIWIGTAEIVDYFSSEEAKQLTITLFWAIYALFLILAGIRVRKQLVVSPKLMTALGALLLAVPIAKLFIHDVFLLETTYRLAAFIILGPLLILTGLAYRKIRDSFA